MSLIDVIDSYILSGAYTNNSGAGMYRHIKERVNFYVSLADSGTLEPESVRGYDKVIARRVKLLYKPAETSTETTKTTTTTVTPETPKDLGLDSHEDQTDNFLVWAGNEPLLCPPMYRYYDDYSSDLAEASNATKYYEAYTASYTRFNEDTDEPIAVRNRMLAFRANLVIVLDQDTWTYTVTNRNDTVRLNKPVTGVSTITPEIELSLATYVTPTTCAGKMLLADDRYTVIQLLDYGTAERKDFLLKPPYKYVGNTGMGFTVNCSLLLIDNTSHPTRVTKLTAPLVALQDKTEIFAGWSDFVISGDKVYAIRSELTETRNFSGFKMTKSGFTYIKKGALKHSLLSLKYAIYEVQARTWSGETVNTQKLLDIVPPEQANKFAVKGAIQTFTWAKLAHSQLNPNVFYVQLGYELILQLPYTGNKWIYHETSTGWKYRTQSDYATTIDDPDYTGFIDEPLQLSLGISMGQLYRVVGQYYLEVSPNNPGLLLYETLGEMNVGISAFYDKWTCNMPFLNCYPPDVYPWDWSGQRADSASVLYTYHAVTSTVVSSAYGLDSNTYRHPMYAKHGLDYMKKYDPQWYTAYLPADDVSYFPLRLAFTSRGGTDYASLAYAGLGYGGFNPVGRTFHVTYVGDKIPLDGYHASDTAKPVLIAVGTAIYIEAWGNSEWANGATAVMGPLCIETLPYQVTNNLVPSYFSPSVIGGAPKTAKCAYTKYLGQKYEYLKVGPLGGYFNVWGMLPLVCSGRYIKWNVSGDPGAGYKIGTWEQDAFVDLLVDKGDPKKILYAALIHIKDTFDGLPKEDAHYLENQYFRFDCKDDPGGSEGQWLDVKLTAPLGFRFESCKWRGTSGVNLFWSPCLIDRV